MKIPEDLIYVILNKSLNSKVKTQEVYGVNSSYRYKKDRT